DHVDAGRLLEGADVASLAADDAPLHVVGRNVDGADRGVGGVDGGVTLNRDGENLAGLLLRRLPKLRLVPLDAGRDLGGELLLDSLEEHLVGLVAGETGDLVESFGLLVDEDAVLLDLLLEDRAPFGELLLGNLEAAFLLELRLVALFESVFALLDPAFGL